MPLGADTALAFFGVAVLLALTPGPDNLFVMVLSAQHGWRAGLAVVVGLCLGLVVHTAAVALGLAAALAAFPWVLTLLQMGGAAYLAWMGWQALSSVATALTAAAPVAPVPSAWRSCGPMVGRGLFMNLTNPKILLFFLAFLPQFVDPLRGSVPAQIGGFGLLFMVATCLVFGAIACFAGRLGGLLTGSIRAQQWLNRLVGVVFFALALRLILTLG